MDEPENEITVTVFRLLVLDLLAMFQPLNKATINILGKFRQEYPLSPWSIHNLPVVIRALLRDVEARCRKSHGRVSPLHKADRPHSTLFERSSPVRAPHP